MIISLLKRLFAKPAKSSKKEAEDVSAPHEPDFIDYDGMGNQGRFPKKTK